MNRILCFVLAALVAAPSASAQQPAAAAPPAEAPMVGSVPLADWLAKWRTQTPDERRAMLDRLPLGAEELPSRSAYGPIAELLSAPDADTREVAAGLLSYGSIENDREGEEQLMSKLAAAMKDVEPRVRLAAARSLGGLAWTVEQHGPSFTLAMDELIELASGVDAKIGLAALNYLSGFGRVEPRLVPLCASVLKTGDVERRRIAAGGLGTALGKYEEARAPLHEALSDADAIVRLNAARTLAGEGENTDEIAGVLEALATDPTETVRWEAINSLASLGVERASETRPLLLAALNDESKNVRTAAAGALGNLGSSDNVDSPEAAARLVELTKDADDVVRGAAAWALGHIGAPAEVAVPALGGLIQDPNPETRGYALDSLKEAGPEVVRALPQLIAALNDPMPATRQSVAQLIALGGPAAADAVAALTARLNDPHLGARLWSAYALRVIGSASAPAMARLATSLAEDPEAKMRVEAARTLAAIGPLAGTVAATLVAAVKDPEVDVRLWSLFALGELGVKSDAVVAALQDAAKSRDDRILAEANKALAKLGLDHDAAAIAKEPAAAPQRALQPISSPFTYSDVVLVLSNASGAAVVHFLDGFIVDEDGAQRRGVRFEFRCLTKGQDEAVGGSGEVVDSRRDASRSELHAGALHVNWSDRGNRSGWIYWQPEQMRVEMVGALDYESLDLRRFLR